MFICHSQLYDDLLVRIKNARAREATKATRQLEVRCSVVVRGDEYSETFCVCVSMIFETFFNFSETVLKLLPCFRNYIIFVFP